ncbi:MAG TPA: UDP-N-acetylmuramyl-tripeptide synthetase [Polyangiaceae bacterium]
MKQRPKLPPPPAFHSELATIGVTGTNGKTTTTTFAAAALGCFGAPVPRVTTVGFFVGEEKLELPGSYEAFVKTLRKGHERGARHAAIELSSEALALGFFHAWPCKVGVFTNLTHDHLDRHRTPEHYLASKAQLFVHLSPGGTAVLNACDPASALLAEVIPKGVRVVHYGVQSRGEPFAPLALEARRIDVSWDGTVAELVPSDVVGVAGARLKLRALGEVYVENALAALGAVLALGAPLDAALRALADAAPPPGRFELVREAPYVVVDYAHTPDALRRTLEQARRLTRGRLCVVFGAGGERDRDKRPEMGRAAALADRVLLTSDNPRSEDPAAIAREIQVGLAEHPAVEVVLDRALAIARAVREAAPDDLVLLAGKGHELEQHAGDAKRPFSDAEIARRSR